MKPKVALRTLAGSIVYISKNPLVKRNLLAAYYRYISFHIRHIFWSEASIYQFIAPLRFYAKPGMSGIVGNIYTGLDDYEEMLFLLHFLRHDDQFLDIGANVGAYSLLAAGISHANVTAFEPSTEIFKLLIRNISLNCLENRIDAVQIGLGNKHNKVHFITSKDALNHVLADGETLKDSLSEQIRIETLDDFSQNLTPILIKIDTEGYEYPILQGAERTISSHTCKAIIIELNGSGKRYGSSDEAVHSLLIEHGFFPIEYKPEARQIVSLKRYNRDRFNTIYIRDMDFVQDRVRSAQAISIFDLSI